MDSTFPPSWQPEPLGSDPATRIGGRDADVTALLRGLTPGRQPAFLAWNELPQPHAASTFGFVIWNPAPMSPST